MQIPDTIIQIHETVQQDTLDYRHQVARFLKGQVSPVAFKAYRVPMGIYEQRESGHYMVRVRLGAGLITPDQLAHVAGLSRQYGNGTLHLTTREDIQLHDLAIEDTPAVLEALLKVGLSTRGGGGNTVRNVAVGPYAGVGPEEVFDVTPHAIALSEYLLQDRSSFSLPRKFKIALSGTSQDDAFASVTDLGFFARIQDGTRGFEVYAAGGMGSSPRIGIKIESFVPETDIFVVAEAAKRLFESHGDRSNKHKARLRYVLARLGHDLFVQTYLEEKQRVLQEGLRGDTPSLRQIMAVPEPLDTSASCPHTQLDVRMEKTAGYYTVRLALPLGDISAEDACRIAECAASLGLRFLRATQSQDLLLLSVPQTHLPQIDAMVQGLSVALQNDMPPMVACAGASTCKLGLCRSRGLAAAIADALQWKIWGSDQALPVIRISGCPNACAQHQIADIGFQGHARRVNGRLMPFYNIFVGARLEQGHTELGHRIGALPAKRVPAFMQEVYEQGVSTIDAFKDCAARHAGLEAGQIPDDYYVDYDACRPFSLAGLGAGECSAGVMDIVNADLQQAQEALTSDHGDTADSLARAVLAAARALLVLFGVEAKSCEDVVQGFKTHLVAPGWVDPQSQDLVQQAATGGLKGDAGSRDSAASLVTRIVALHGSLDGQLNFTLAPVAEPVEVSQGTVPGVVDLRGVACPMNFVKAKLALERVEVGCEVELLLDLGEARKNVSESLKQQGQQVLKINELKDCISLIVKREK
ncbi:MAG: sulfurtransferase TusA family protein [Phycisphaerae bacterium]|nr:sulfurtransferase TusA family protein [Phycisphaerae bacterium]